jgi:hypothetical protein
MPGVGHATRCHLLSSDVGRGCAAAGAMSRIRSIPATAPGSSSTATAVRPDRRSAAGAARQQGRPPLQAAVRCSRSVAMIRGVPSDGGSTSGGCRLRVAGDSVDELAWPRAPVMPKWNRLEAPFVSRISHRAATRNVRCAARPGPGKGPGFPRCAAHRPRRSRCAGWQFGLDTYWGTSQRHDCARRESTCPKVLGTRSGNASTTTSRKVFAGVARMRIPPRRSRRGPSTRNALALARPRR